MINIFLPIEFKKRHTSNLFVRERKMMQIDNFLHIGKMLHQQNFQVGGKFALIELRDNKILRGR